MTDRLIRLMRIITIVQANPGILARELAERCETSERTIYRDMEALSAMHIPITNLGHGKGYAFISNFALYPLNWTEEEAAAFSMLSVVMDKVKPLLPSAFERAYEKVMASTQKKKIEQANIAQQVSNIIHLGRRTDWEEQPYYLMPIILASLSQHTIEAEYHPVSHEEEVTVLRIDPYCLIPQERRFYMLGYCHYRSAVRTFRISRFRNVRVLPRTFSKDKMEIEAFFRHTWGMKGGDNTTRFVVRFSSEWADIVRAEELFVKPEIQQMSDGSLLFEVVVNNENEFLTWLKKFGPGAEILHPTAQRKQFADMLADWSRMYLQPEHGT
ncbi:WYL domain-containing protein [Paenibacillus sp. P96]|uniref:WYL domain-containing protein n=1 Tax=Paenibacillus zeirhizosphaerae TaxID=2987519 RepID=A0ABT9FWA1_9BACL|nr:WYL domain-containing protein [Paenibacillus sp. P96]MDP4099001.1 WYL domain-containing protein [Paenibacillus sp. P96]